MDDLSSSTFFDQRTITFIQELLWRGGKGVTPLTGLESRLQERVDDLHSLNDQLDGKLVEELHQCKGFVATPDAIQFLLSAMEAEILDEAVTALFVAVRDERRLNGEQLRELIRDNDEIPMLLNVYIAGDYDVSRYDTVGENFLSNTGLDMERLRSFK